MSRSGFPPIQEDAAGLEPWAISLKLTTLREQSSTRIVRDVLVSSLATFAGSLYDHIPIWGLAES